MTPFTVVSSVAAAVPDSDVNTDVIFPARFLLLPDKAGLGRQLFHEKRHVLPGQPPFVLDRPPFDAARILVGGANFGCGSSREQAVWALADFGIRCVVAPSFGEIFFANCLKNGVLPLVEEGARHAAILAAAEAGQTVTIDLERQEIRLGDATALPFAIDPYRRKALLLGLDEIGSILANDSADIATFEAGQRADQPWLYLSPAQLACFADLGEETALD